MTTASGQKRPGGRSERVRRAVVEATAEAVARGGSDEVSIPQIARQAGVHDSSIYRRWPTKQQLIFDALLEYSEDLLSVPDTGTLRGDLVAYMRVIGAHAGTPMGRALIEAMIGSDDDDRMREERRHFWQARLQRVQVIFERAAVRGELGSSDPMAALEVLTGAFYFRLLLTREEMDEEMAARFVDVLLHGV